MKKELTEVQKEIFDNAVNIVNQTLIMTMHCCDIPQLITSTSEANGYRYKLKFEKEEILNDCSVPQPKHEVCEHQWSVRCKHEKSTTLGCDKCGVLLVE